MAAEVLAVAFAVLLGPRPPVLAETERPAAPPSADAAVVEGGGAALPAAAPALPPEHRAVEAATVPERDLGQGEASFYHSSLEGRPTASGAAYRGAELTAAHRTLPFGTRLKVTNVRNGKSVLVTVNDRGPFHPRRVLDLSHEAARRLDMLHSGRAKVKLEILRPEPPRRLELRAPLGGSRFPF